MAYQQCANRVVETLKEDFPEKIWNTNNDDDISTVVRALYKGFGKHALMFDGDAFNRVCEQIFKALTIPNYKIPLIEYDIDPSLRQFNEYDKDYDECVEEDIYGDYHFNLPESP